MHENLSENNYSGKEKLFEATSAENAEPSGELSKTKVLGSSQSPVECGSNLDHDEFDLSFDTTREEMILYEKFGQDYDEIVEKMTREEKISLKQEISKATPKDANELLRAKEPTDVDGKADADMSVSKVDKVKLLKLRYSDSYTIQIFASAYLWELAKAKILIIYRMTFILLTHKGILNPSYFQIAVNRPV